MLQDTGEKTESGSSFSLPSPRNSGHDRAHHTKKPWAFLPTAVNGLGVKHDHRAEVTPAALFAAALIARAAAMVENSVDMASYVS